ncbi:hypothetical protein ERJ70_15750 [Sediminibacillus dalangtanensis]|uniref:Uncharacterized protein n=1 Tax=Sediminibacillus dalangtanensis TaxID=2729421 RepID=A0ABX7VUR8_9BACI|nr:permease prefix domain 1-containing protein [Sediminibacillus dalangtanensis]QTN00620.1 hypothetical protein ERJ70_15750 [Sediminibacillus dalangtanensis]
MSKRLKAFVDKTVRQIEGNQQEKEDLAEELLTHLQLSKQELMEVEKLSDKEAEMKAIRLFGDEAAVGSQIQQAMFPYRKEMMLALSGSSILFSFCVYLAQLFLEGDAYIFWLVLSVIVSSSLLVLSLKPVTLLNRRLWMNSLLIVYLAVYLFGLLLATGVRTSAVSSSLIVFVSLLLLLAIVLIYRTTLHDYKSGSHPLPKQAKWLHAINITAGIIVIGVVLFFLWGVLIFTGELVPAMALGLLPLIIWIGLYVMQMNLIRRHKRIAAFGTAIVPLLVIGLAVSYFIYDLMQM